MLTLRNYREEDAETVCSWVGDEKIMYQWSAHWISEYPFGADKLNSVLETMKAQVRLIPLTFTDEEGAPRGFLFIRYTDIEKREVRFGFVIVDSAIRGKGYGKEMLSLAVAYAFDILGASKITLGVFENNPAAKHAYEAAGFVATGEREPADLKIGLWYSAEMEYAGPRIA